jgi:hypothetical protein
MKNGWRKEGTRNCYDIEPQKFEINLKSKEAHESLLTERSDEALLVTRAGVSGMLIAQAFPRLTRGKWDAEGSASIS